MNCTAWTEQLVEGARRRQAPDTALRSHLAICLGCRDRWAAERALTTHLRSLQAETAELPRSADDRRAALMREFARTHATPRKQQTRVRAWNWGLTAAAAVVLAAFAGHEIGVRTRHPSVTSPATRTHGVRRSDSILYEASIDASALSNEDFVAIPYTPPLAVGEMIRVIRAELYPDALANMGIDMDPASTASVAAEVVLGEDGIPRAVRIAEVSDF